MILVAVTIVLFIGFVFVMLIVTGSIIAFSGDEPVKPNPVTPAKVKSRTEPEPKPKPELKAYIDVNKKGMLVELLSKAEIAEAKKNGYKIVYK